MRGKSVGFLALALLIMVLGALAPSTVFAKGSAKYKADVVIRGTTDDVGKATLTLKVGKKQVEVEVKLKTKELNPKHVFSVWGQINEETPTFSLSGFISSKKGTGEFKVRVKIDRDKKGSLPISQFKVTLKDHGPPLKGKKSVEKQQTTKDFGCSGGMCPSVQTATFFIP